MPRSSNYSRFSALLISLILSSLSQLVSADDTSSKQPEILFKSAHQAALQLPRLHSLLISQQGTLVYERYYNGANATHTANMKSASKSVISALVGIAIAEKYIESVDQDIADYFPQLLSITGQDQKSGITIENLLTMQSGFESTSNRNYGSWVLSDNWINYVLSQPLVTQPGGSMIYSTGNTHLLSAIITVASGQNSKQFAQKYLTSPLGFSMSYWSTDPQGIYFGGNNMEWTPRQMLAFGNLYLQGGNYQGQQILPSEWVEKSFQAHAESPRGQGRHYGYGWWLRELAELQVPVAWGYGGQLIFVVKELDLVVVATSESEPGPDRRGHLGSLYLLVEDQVLKALLPES